MPTRIQFQSSNQTRQGFEAEADRGRTTDRGAGSPADAGSAAAPAALSHWAMCNSATIMGCISGAGPTGLTWHVRVGLPLVVAVAGRRAAAATLLTVAVPPTICNKDVGTKQHESIRRLNHTVDAMDVHEARGTRVLSKGSKDSEGVPLSSLLERSLRFLFWCRATATSDQSSHTQGRE